MKDDGYNDLLLLYSCGCEKVDTLELRVEETELLLSISIEF